MKCKWSQGRRSTIWCRCCGRSSSQIEVISGPLSASEVSSPNFLTNSTFILINYTTTQFLIKFSSPAPAQASEGFFSNITVPMECAASCWSTCPTVHCMYEFSLQPLGSPLDEPCECFPNTSSLLPLTNNTAQNQTLINCQHPPSLHHEIPRAPPLTSSCKARRLPQFPLQRLNKMHNHQSNTHNKVLHSLDTRRLVPSASRGEELYGGIL